MLNANEDEVYVKFKNGETKLNDITFNELQRLIKQDITNQIIEERKITYPVRFYIHNTNRD